MKINSCRGCRTHIWKKSKILL